MRPVHEKVGEEADPRPQAGGDDQDGNVPEAFAQRTEQEGPWNGDDLDEDDGDDELVRGQFHFFDTEGARHQHDGLNRHAHDEKAQQIPGNSGLSLHVPCDRPKLPEPLPHEVPSGAVLDLYGHAPEGDLRPSCPPESNGHERPSREVVADAHDQCQTHDQQNDGAHEPPREPFGRQEVLLLFGGDFWKECIVEAEAAPRADVGHKEGGHAPFKVVWIKPIEGDAAGGAHVAEAFEKQKLSAEIVCHASQQGGGQNDNQKRSPDDVAVQLCVDEVHTEEGHDVGWVSGLVYRGGHRIVEERKDGRGDDEEIA